MCSLTCFYCKVFFNRRTCGQVLSVLSTWSQLSTASVQGVHVCGWHVAQGRMYGAVECELHSGTCFVRGMLGFKPSPSGISLCFGTCVPCTFSLISLCLFSLSFPIIPLTSDAVYPVNKNLVQRSPTLVRFWTVKARNTFNSILPDTVGPGAAPSTASNGGFQAQSSLDQPKNAPGLTRVLAAFHVLKLAK